MSELTRSMRRVQSYKSECTYYIGYLIAVIPDRIFSKVQFNIINFEEGSDFLYHKNDNLTKMTTVLGEPQFAPVCYMY